MDERDEARYLERLRNGTGSSASSKNSENSENPDDSKSKRCVECGHMAPITAKICLQCGNRLE